MNDNQGVMVYCRKCGRLHGIQTDGMTLFKIGHLWIRSVSAICSCGEPFYRTSSDIVMGQIVQNTMNSKEEK